VADVETIRLAPPYRKKPNRLPGHDYRQPGAYFVTLCRHDPGISFGEVVAGEMVPNAVGYMILAEWHALSVTVSGIELDSVMLMPDHLHGIIVLGTDPEVRAWPSLGEIVGRYKNASNRRYFAKVRAGIWPPIDQRVWQLRSYDRIVRNDRELERSRAYIAANPVRWKARRRGGP
jgi:REP element-mobilizing transposase RayT